MITIGDLNRLMGLGMPYVRNAESADVEDAFITVLSAYGIEDIDVIAEKDGLDWIITFEDDDGDTETIVFSKDEEGAFAIILSDIENDDDEESTIVDLSTFDPPTMPDGSLDLVNLAWINKSALSALIANIEEVYKKTAVRGGKKVKIPIRVVKKKLTSRQKIALIKARRKAHTGKAQKRRAFSLKIRKRMGIK